MQWQGDATRQYFRPDAKCFKIDTQTGKNKVSYYEKERQREAWITVQRGHAVANGLPVISVNRCGFEEDPSSQTSGIDFWGSSFVAGPQGEFLFEAPDNAPVEEVVEVDLGRSEDVRRWWPFLRDRRIENYGEITKRFLI